MRRPLRIVMISNLCPPDFDGGFEQRALQLANSLRSRGHSVALVTSGYRSDYQGVRNDPDWVHRILEYAEPGERGLARYTRFLATMPASLRNAKSLETWLSEREFDVAYLFGLHRIGLATHTPLARRAIPILWHAGDHYLANQLKVWPRKSPPYRWLLRTLHSRSRALEESGDYRRIAFVSESLRDYYAAVDLPTEKPYVIPRGADFKLGRDVDRPRAHPPTFFMACRLHEQKGAHVAIEAAASLARSQPGLEWRLHIAGRVEHPSYHERLLKAIETHNLSSRVSLVGQMAREIVLQRMRDATAVIHASIFDDPFANTIIEALACGTPLIGSDVGSIREVVTQDKSALLFAKGDAGALAQHMELILTNPELIEELASEGIRVVDERYTIERILELTENALYETARLGSEAECVSA